MTPEKTSPVERCHVVLRRLLAAGPRSAGEIKEALDSSGYAFRTVQDAAVRLNVQRTKSGMVGAWIWALPVEATEGTSLFRAFGKGDPVKLSEPKLTCLAAYGYEVPGDGLMHGVPHRD